MSASPTFDSIFAAPVSPTVSSEKQPIVNTQPALLPNGPKLFPKPRGRAPKDKTWNAETGVWEDIPTELRISTTVTEVDAATELGLETASNSSGSSTKLTAQEKEQRRAEKAALREAKSKAEEEAKALKKAEKDAAKAAKALATEEARLAKEAVKAAAKAEKEAALEADKKLKEQAKAAKAIEKSQKDAEIAAEKERKAAARAGAKAERDAHKLAEKEAKEAARLAALDPVKEAEKAAKKEQSAANKILREQKAEARRVAQLRKEAVKAAKLDKEAKKTEKKAALELELEEQRRHAEAGDAEAASFIEKHDARIKSQELASRVMKACSALKKALGHEELAEHLENLVAESDD